MPFDFGTESCLRASVLRGRPNGFNAEHITKQKNLNMLRNRQDLKIIGIITKNVFGRNDRAFPPT